MKQPETVLQQGTKIKTHEKLNEPHGMLLGANALENRAPSTVGSIMLPAPGHGGDVYFVKHDEGVVAAYCWDEFELEEQ